MEQFKIFNATIKEYGISTRRSYERHFLCFVLHGWCGGYYGNSTHIQETVCDTFLVSHML